MEAVPYNGDRSLEALSKAVMNFISAPFFLPVASSDIDTFKTKNEVGIFMVYDPTLMDSSILGNFEMAVRPWVGSLKIYVTPDDDAYSHLGSSKTDKKALLVVSKGYGKSLEAYTGSFQDIKSLSSWIVENKDPLVIPLDSSNQNEIFNGKSLIVLALVDPDANRTTWSTPLESVIRTWTPEKTHKPVKFVWLDAILHSGYAKRVYSLKSTELPRLVIADPISSVYYDTDSHGALFVFDESLILEYISSALDGKLQVKCIIIIVGQIIFWNIRKSIS